MERGFEGWNVVVTGGAGALGSAVVRALLDAGAACHVPDLADSPPPGLPAHERLTFSGGIDLADEASASAFFASVPDLRASVHLAGGFAMAAIADTSLADFRAMLDLNLTTCFLCCREAIRGMRAGPAGAERRGGRIVNVAARPALVPAGGMIAYSTSKAGVASLTRCLAEEVKADGILVNAVAPSVIDTPANRRAMPGADHAAWPKPDEIAEAILFLASPANGLTSGALIPVYGRA